VIVHRVAIAGDPLLERMAAAISGAGAAPVLSVGDLVADLRSGPQSRDRDMPAAQKIGNIQGLSFDPGAPGVIVRAAIYYPPGGGLGWHTNSARPGWRAYVPRGDIGVTLTENGPVLDLPGHANLFEVPAWHAIAARGERWSIGVLLPPGHRLIPN
jgi:hypothetical protein